MHPTESNRIIKALGDPNQGNTYTIYSREGIWMISDESGVQLLSDWLKKIPMHDRSDGKDLIPMIIKSNC